jgi:tight adherence protein C
MSEPLIPFALALLALSCILALGYVALRVQQHTATSRTMQVIIDSYAARSSSTSGSGTAGLPGYQRAFTRVGELITSSNQRRRLQGLLDYAGRPDASALARALRDKVAVTATGLILGILFTLAVGGWAWISIPLLTSIGYWLPDLLAYNAGLRRTEQIRRSLPDAIELLSLCVQSGMGFQGALAQVAEYQNGPVAQEFARVLREMQLGQSRRSALEGLARRSREEDLKRFVAAIAQADQLGIAVSGVLNEQAAELRSKRRDRAKEAAQKVPVKILLPVIACFLPGIFIIVLGPATLSLFRLFSSL